MNSNHSKHWVDIALSNSENWFRPMLILICYRLSMFCSMFHFCQSFHIKQCSWARDCMFKWICMQLNCEIRIFMKFFRKLYKWWNRGWNLCGSVIDRYDIETFVAWQLDKISSFFLFSTWAFYQLLWCKK